MHPFEVAPADRWLVEVAESARGSASAAQQLLHAVRVQLGMDVAWSSDFVGDEQVFRFVDAAAGLRAPQVGGTAPLSGSYCARVVDGRLPSLIPDARQDPSAALLEGTRELQIGAYVGVPLLDVQGAVTGMLCATSTSAMPTLGDDDVRTMRLLAQLLHDLQVMAVADAAAEDRRRTLQADVRRVIVGEGRWAVLQPIVSAATGEVVALEGLSRFDGERTPAQWFDVAQRAGLGPQLELAAAASVLALLADGCVPDRVAVSVNLSPATVVAADLERLLAGHDPHRVIVEITEHDPVSDYDALAAVLGGWRLRGLRVAVDDAGAGYASLRHVLLCRPDLVKLDMALIRGVDTDAVRRALVRAVVDFAGQAGAMVIAEGVETEPERAALTGLGVPLLQGYLLGAPAAVVRA